MGSVIMGKADRNDQSAAGYNVEQTDMDHHSASKMRSRRTPPNTKRSKQAWMILSWASKRPPRST